MWSLISPNYVAASAAATGREGSVRQSQRQEQVKAGVVDPFLPQVKAGVIDPFLPLLEHSAHDRRCSQPTQTAVYGLWGVY